LKPSTSLSTALTALRCLVLRCALVSAFKIGPPSHG
jgi:hypothetical protein